MTEQEDESNMLAQQFEHLMLSLHNSDEWKKVQESVGPMKTDKFLLNPMTYSNERITENEAANTNSEAELLPSPAPSSNNDNTDSTLLEDRDNDGIWRVNNDVSSPLFHEQTTRKHLEQLTALVKKVLKNEINFAINLSKRLQERLLKCWEQFDEGNPPTTPDTSKDSMIVNNISKFLKLPSNVAKRRMNSHLEAVIQGIWCSASGGDITC